MTDQGAFAGTRPITWPRAAVGAAVFLGLIVVLIVVIPNQLVTPDPSQLTKTITIVYVVVLFAVVAWMVAAWQNRGQATPLPVSQKVSAFGRPMREGPGFTSFAEKAVPIPQSHQAGAKAAGIKPARGVSSFGRPMKKGPG